MSVKVLLLCAVVMACAIHVTQGYVGCCRSCMQAPVQRLVYCDRVLERDCASLCRTTGVECLAYEDTGFLYKCFCN